MTQIPVPLPAGEQPAFISRLDYSDLLLLFVRLAVFVWAVTYDGT